MLIRAFYYGLTDGFDYVDPSILDEKVGSRLHDMAVFASSTIALWRDVFKASGLDPERIKSPEALCQLPFSSKKDLLAKPLEERLGIPASECVVMSTSGTTGGPMPVFYSKKFFDYMAGVIRFRIRRMQGCPSHLKSATITYDANARLANDPNNRPLAVRRSNAMGLLTPLASPLYDRLTKRFYIATGVQDIMTGLIEFGPGRISGSPAYMRMIADASRTDPSIEFNLHSIISIGEPLDEPTRRYLETSLDCDVFDGYGSNETGIVAVECKHKSGLHIMTDSVIVEVLRDGEPVKKGEEGDVFVTTLKNRAMPLFRYDMGDRAVLGGSGCACGRKTAVLKSIEVRRLDYVMAGDGRMVSPRRISSIIHSIDCAPKCQLVELERFRFQLRIFDEGNPKELVDALARELGDVTISVSLEKPDVLKAKFRPVISRLSLLVDSRWTKPVKQLQAAA